MRLAELRLVSDRVAETPRRLEKITLLAEALRRSEPGEVETVVALLSGRTRQGRIGLGPAAVRAALAAAAPAAGASGAGAELSVIEVDRALERLAALGGAGSGGQRTAELAALLRRARRAEAEWLAHVLLGEVRQGALEGLMAEAVAQATGLPIDAVRRAVMLAGDVGEVAAAALARGPAGLGEFGLQLFRPVQPMLAQPAGDVDEALVRLGEAALEYKLDGARVQVHRRGDEVAVYSRQLNDVTARVPELVEAVRALPATELIADGEVLAVQPGGRPHPFQVTMRRFGGRLDVAARRAELPLRAVLFDVLRLDGQDLLDAQGRERSAALEALAPSLLVPRLVTADTGRAEEFFDQALAAGHEGLMVKSLEAPYAAGARGSGWFKVKPAHTLDLVVLAAEWGSGRRQGWLSNLHLGARDPAGARWHMIGKTFKGLTDATLEWQTRRLQELQLGTDGWVVHVRPELLVEVAFNDVQASPRYESGVALRFARVRRYRPDKPAAEADTIDTVRDILGGRLEKRRR